MIRLKPPRMKLLVIDRNNLQAASEIQKTLFPGADAFVNYVESIKGITDNEYWIIEENGQHIGVSGIYSLPQMRDSAWLGWFGILEKYRRMGLGSKALKLFEAEAKKRGYRFVRLYTGRYNNATAKSFYESNGYIEEHYDCTEDPGSAVEKLSIYSKSLYADTDIIPWKSKNLHIDEQLQKQAMGEKMRALFFHFQTTSQR